MKSSFTYAVVEVSLDGKIDMGVSHWHYTDYSKALAFANEIGSNNADRKFYIIQLTRGK